jgi:hypothetical protein
MPYLGIGESVRDGRLLQVLGVLRNGIVGAVLTALAALSTPASALVVELTDVGADRVERQRAWARGEMPLPGTPDVATVDARLAAKGLAEGDAVFIRIFKAESQLEVWMRKGNGFVLFETYPICHWTGTLGPKIREGDSRALRDSTASRLVKAAIAAAGARPSTSVFPMRSISACSARGPTFSCTAAARPRAASR